VVAALKYHNVPSNTAQYDATISGDPSGVTVLAVLAHEFGHILWYDWNKQLGGSFDPTNLETCKDNRPLFFHSWQTWLSHDSLLEPPPWRDFGMPAIRGRVKHIVGPQPDEFDGSSDLLSKLEGLYNVGPLGAPWATLLGSLTPDEDFVETYVFSVLTQNGLLTSFGVTLGQDAPIPMLSSPSFLRKLGCMNGLVQTNPQPLSRSH
jgi:hypothetical protein